MASKIATGGDVTETAQIVRAIEPAELSSASIAKYDGASEWREYGALLLRHTLFSAGPASGVAVTHLASPGTLTETIGGTIGFAVSALCLRAIHKHKKL